jgi:CrcB protein
MIAVWVSIAAAAGAVLRYLLGRSVQRWHPSTLPWGTFAINVTGSFALGLLTGLGLHHGWSPDAVSILGTGLLGGYTTWSTYIWESVAIAVGADSGPGADGAAGAALLNLAGSIAVGVAAAAAGLGIALL